MPKTRSKRRPKKRMNASEMLELDETLAVVRTRYTITSFQLSALTAMEKQGVSIPTLADLIGEEHATVKRMLTFAGARIDLRMVARIAFELQLSLTLDVLAAG